MMQFPLNAPQNKPEEPGRYGFGTTAAFDAFVKQITNYTDSQEIFLAVNIATLLRNNISTSAFVDGQKIEAKNRQPINTSTVVKDTRLHMVEMANELANICDMKFKDRKHHILYYLTDVTKQVPSAWMRPRTSESATKLDAVIKAFCNVVHSSDQTSNNVQLHVRLANQMRVPAYRGIIEQMKNWTARTSNIHLISHEPIDYHVAQASARQGFLYRSHTGAVVPLTPNELGKVVFKNENVPFYPQTHILLGDKTLIKGCLAKKERDAFIKTAETERLGLRTSDFISYKIKSLGYSLPYTI